MAEPKRIQRKRTGGWKMPEGAVYVGRPSKWGNPFSIVQTPQPRWAGPRRWHVEDETGRVFYPEEGREPIIGRAATERVHRIEAATLAVEKFALHIGLMGNHEYDDETLAELRSRLGGRDLACWCPLDQPCHADVLLELANPKETP